MHREVHEGLFGNDYRVKRKDSKKASAPRGEEMKRGDDAAAAAAAAPMPAAFEVPSAFASAVVDVPSKPGWYPDPYPEHNHGEHFVIHTIDKMRHLRVVHRKSPVVGGWTNAFDVYGKQSEAAPDDRVFVVREDSQTWSRTCATPFHSLLLHVEHPETREVLLTLERPGVECCCDAAPRGHARIAADEVAAAMRTVKTGVPCATRCARRACCELTPVLGWGGPKPCLCCCAWSYRCQDELFIHSGWHVGDAARLDVHTSNNLGQVYQPDLCELCMIDGSLCSPTLEVRTKGGHMLGVFEGPACWGGLCGTCCGPFAYSHAPNVSQNKGSMYHKEGGSSDAIYLDFDAHNDGGVVEIPGIEKIKVFSAALLAWYMFFGDDSARDATAFDAASTCRGDDRTPRS